MSDTWVPDACTLPTAEQPLRVAEFDDVFAGAVRGVDRIEASSLRLELEPTPEVAARVADLAARESLCCSFFTFTLSAGGDGLRLDVGVPAARVDVLDALAERAGRRS